jgi:hypothetical protein
LKVDVMAQETARLEGTKAKELIDEVRAELRAAE